MATFTEKVRERIEAQGFCGLSDEACAQLNYPLPRYGVRRRFACAMATAMLVVAAWAFQAGMPVLGTIFGWSLVAAAFVNVSTGFCIPSFIVRLLFGKVVCERPTRAAGI